MPGKLPTVLLAEDNPADEFLVKQAIRDVLDLDLPNLVQMDCSLLSGLLAEALLKKTPPHLEAIFFCNSGTEAIEGALKQFLLLTNLRTL